MSTSLSESTTCATGGYLWQDNLNLTASSSADGVNASYAVMASNFSEPITAWIAGSTTLPQWIQVSSNIALLGSYGDSDITGVSC